MPRLQDIELFKRDLAALSHEAEVLERWGEKPEVITPPEGAAAASGVAAPGIETGPSPDSAAARKAPAAGAEEGPPPDFAALLDGLPLGPERGEEEPAGAGSLDDDLAALLSGAPESEEAAPDFEAVESAEAAIPEMQETAEAQAAPESEAFDFTMPDIEGVAEEAMPVSPELPEAEPPGGAPTEAAPIEDFSIPDFDTAEEKPDEAVPAESVGAAFDADFSIPDLGGEAGQESPAEELVPEPVEEPSAGAGEPAGEELGSDAFETFTFEEPGAAPEAGSGEFLSGAGIGPGQDLDTEIASLSEEAPVADTFKIDQDWGGFGSFGGEGAKEGPVRPAPPPRAAPQARQAEEKFKPVSLSEAQVDRLQDSLLSYPLNLRVAIEDVIANDKGSEAQQSKLVWALVDGASAEEAAALAGRVLKRHIPIPKGREKRTGAALEAERGSFAYAFIHTFLPVIKIGLLVLVAASAIGYLGWRFVYVPLAADSLYRTGYQRVAEDRYPEAETDFAKATAMREFIAWYYRYAEAYAAKRQYILAEKKYASLVAAHPRETKGILAWARLEKEQLKFEEAVMVLQGAPRSVKGEAARGMTGLLSWDYFNKEGLLLLGDVYLDWAEEAPGKYEDARRTYAKLLERYGDEEVYLERMLLYFIRVDKLKEVLPLKAHFLADPKKSALSALVLAELGGYLLDKDRLEDLRDILLSAAKKDPAVPEAHYHLARYFRRSGDPTEERKALDNAVRTFAALPGLGARRTGMYIESLIWRARFLVQAKEWLGAERDFASAAAEYEKALELRRVAKSGRFGEAYAGLADVAYWQRDDLASALALYERAEANGFATKDTSYKRGNILYRTERYKESLEQFYRAQDKGAASPYLDYAFGSAFGARNDLFSAEAYYRRVSAAMEKLLADVGEPAPQERPSEVEILGLYLRSENNLGVALYRSAARSGDARRRNEAMATLTHSVRLYDLLSQESTALEGPEARNLALENMNVLLRTGKGENLRVYTLIEKDTAFPKR
jgi:tetratricopeptide (TPR) repeat protein